MVVYHIQRLSLYLKILERSTPPEMVDYWTYIDKLSNYIKTQNMIEV